MQSSSAALWGVIFACASVSWIYSSGDDKQQPHVEQPLYKTFRVNDELHRAVGAGSYLEAKTWLQNGACVNRRCEFSGKSPLDCAVLNGYRDIVGLLLHSGALACLQDEDGNTALHHAAAAPADRDDVLAPLIAHDTSVLPKNKEGETPLHAAVIEDNMACVRTLTSHVPAQVGAVDVQGATPLHWAARLGHVGCVRILLRSGADPSVQDGFGRTPCECARAMSRHGSDAVHIVRHKKGLHERYHTAGYHTIVALLAAAQEGTYKKRGCMLSPRSAHLLCEHWVRAGKLATVARAEGSRIDRVTLARGCRIACFSLLNARIARYVALHMFGQGGLPLKEAVSCTDRQRVYDFLFLYRYLLGMCDYSFGGATMRESARQLRRKISAIACFDRPCQISSGRYLRLPDGVVGTMSAYVPAFEDQ